MPFEITATAEEIASSYGRLDGKVVIVTGGSTGIGKETARVFAIRGAHVIVASRGEKMRKAVAELINVTGSKHIQGIELELSSIASIHQFAEEFNKLNLPLNYLILNAGVMACPRAKTVDGIELQFGTNFVGHFLLTNLLIPSLLKGAPSRVVSVSSAGCLMTGIIWDDYNFEKKYSEWIAYGQSKAANVLFAVELNNRYHHQGITAVSLHPGVIDTELGRHIDRSDPNFWSNIMKEIPNCEQVMRLSKIPSKTIGQGASTTLYAALSDEVKGGKFYNDNHEEIAPDHAINPEEARKLWDLGLKLSKLQAQPYSAK